MKHIKAKATTLAFLKGTAIPPNNLTAKIVVGLSTEYIFESCPYMNLVTSEIKEIIVTKGTSIGKTTSPIF